MTSFQRRLVRQRFVLAKSGSPLRRIVPALLVAVSAALSCCEAGAQSGNFAPISGSLSIRAGNHAPQSTPAVIGSASLSDNSFPMGFDIATASLQTSIVGNRLFNFSAGATSITSSPPSPGQVYATAGVTFEQSFTTTTPLWIQLTTKVLSPPTDSAVTAALTFSRSGQPPAFSTGHTGNGEVTFNRAFPPGTYVVQGLISTSAIQPTTHSGAISGFLQIAAIADFNSNVQVNGADLTFIRNGFGSTSGTFASGNLDGDSDTDGADFLLWQRQVGAELVFPAVVLTPEPGGAALAAVAGLALVRRRRASN